MWGISDQARVYLCIGATDMRKSINSLSALVMHDLSGQPLSGDLFAFCNRSRTIVKILYWYRNGFCLWQKKLDSGRFHWPDCDRELRQVDQDALGWLLDGLDIAQAHARIEAPLLA